MSAGLFADPGLLALLAGGLGLAGLGGLGAGLRRLRQKLRLSHSEQTRWEESLATAADGYFLWPLGDPAPPPVCSRQLAVLLGLFDGTAARFADVTARFSGAEAALLEQAVTRLREEGQGFSLTLTATPDGRSLLLRGCRAETAGGQPMADLLWVRDISDSEVRQAGQQAEINRLQAEAEALRRRMDGLPVPLWVRDNDLSLIDCNRAYARAAEAADPAQAVAGGCELAGAAGLREARALAARARAAGDARSELFPLVIGGERKMIELIETPVPDPVQPDGAVPPGSGQRMTIGLAVDRSVEAALRDQLDRHSAAHADVLESLGTAIAIFSADTRLSFHNTAFARLWQLDPDWLRSGPAYGAVLDQLRSQRRLPEVADWRSWRDGELQLFTALLEDHEDLLHLPDGRTLRRTCAAHPFGGLLFTYEDVTDALALERSLTTSLAVQRATLDHLYEGVAVIGGDGRLRLSNPAYGRIWGVSAQDLADAPHLGDLVERFARFFPHVSDWPGLRDSLLGLGVDRVAQQGRLERADGLVLDFTAVPLPDGGVLTTWQDVTDSVRVERALRERNDALAAADRLKSAFIANVSMEVRTPLTSILGFAEILGGGYYGPLNSRQQDYIGHIIGAGRQLTQVISDILDLATIEAGYMRLSLNAVDVHAMLAGVLGLVRERLRAKRQVLNFDCPPEIGWMVADERRIRQVLFTLLSSAIETTPDAGQILVSALRQGGELLFTFADTGPGLTAEEQTHLFDSFEERDPAAPGRPGGGAGLALVRTFVEMHGGQIELYSVPGEGTTLIVHLPAGGEEG